MQQFSNPESLIDIGTQMLQLIVKKQKEISTGQLQVIPLEKPGFLRSKLPASQPLKGEPLEQILKDTEEIIFPGQTLWCHPAFFGYYPANVSHAAIIAEIYSTAFSTPGFQWITNPVQTELEHIVCDWVVQAMNLPEKFLMKNQGGGTISTTVSDSIFLSVHAAKQRKIKELGLDQISPKTLNFVAYYSANVHVSSQKALILKDIYYKRAVPVYKDQALGNYKVDLLKFKEMLEEDIKNGLIPIWYGSSWGTLPTCAYDQIQEIGEICKAYKIWLNVDAAYAGISWFVPEYREKVKGLELVDSLQINFAKMGLSGIPGTLTYIADKSSFPEYMGNFSKSGGILKNKFTDEHEDNQMLDYMDFQVHQGRKFHSLKLWWVLRSYGIEGLRENVYSKVRIATYFEKLILGSDIFSLFTKPELGVVTFYLIGPYQELQNRMNENLNQLINQETTKGFITSLAIDGVFFLRVSITNETTTEKHIDTFWEHINGLAKDVSDHIQSLFESYM